MTEMTHMTHMTQILTLYCEKAHRRLYASWWTYILIGCMLRQSILHVIILHVRGRWRIWRRWRDWRRCVYWLTCKTMCVYKHGYIDRNRHTIIHTTVITKCCKTHCRLWIRSTNKYKQVLYITARLRHDRYVRKTRTLAQRHTIEGNRRQPLRYLLKSVWPYIWQFQYDTAALPCCAHSVCVVSIFVVDMFWRHCRWRLSIR